jgi:broad-specificity NMP kinase
MTGATFELWGLPGAGKSTVAAALREMGRVKVATVPSLRDSFLRDPVHSSLLTARLLAEGYKGPGLRRFSVRQSTTERDEELKVLEEGFVHELWRTLFNQPALIADSCWHPYLKLSRAAVIVLTLHPELAHARIKTKLHPGPVNQLLKDSPPEGEIWRTAVTAYERIFQELRKAGRKVLELNMVDRTVDSACSEIERIVEGADVGPTRPAAGQGVRHG